ncbi:hypothetical protein HYALB_00013288 [Hymenoscyphus albidus]|uniref:Uncharacterized protein n=1 Tax=Hymenoscyphus albidus TaxID=595503 RepID=A0A9N9QAF9_9HELO|nr:hypothetical protein HYALB_00013288 [Hymenoscyphus albidus]
MVAIKESTCVRTLVIWSLPNARNWHTSPFYWDPSGTQVPLSRPIPALVMGVPLSKKIKWWVIWHEQRNHQDGNRWSLRLNLREFQRPIAATRRRATTAPPWSCTGLGLLMDLLCYLMEVYNDFIQPPVGLDHEPQEVQLDFALFSPTPHGMGLGVQLQKQGSLGKTTRKQLRRDIANFDINGEIGLEWRDVRVVTVQEATPMTGLPTLLCDTQTPVLPRHSQNKTKRLRTLRRGKELESPPGALKSGKRAMTQQRARLRGYSNTSKRQIT